MLKILMHGNKKTQATEALIPATIALFSIIALFYDQAQYIA